MFIPPNCTEPSPEERRRAEERAKRREFDDLVKNANECLGRGSQPAEVRKSLIARGLRPQEAQHIVQQLLQTQAGRGSADGGEIQLDEAEELSLLEAAGRRNMAIGGLVCVVGLVISLASLASVSTGGGGVIAWGAVIYGGIQFVRGCSQVQASKR